MLSLRWEVRAGYHCYHSVGKIDLIIIVITPFGKIELVITVITPLGR